MGTKRVEVFPGKAGKDGDVHISTKAFLATNSTVGVFSLIHFHAQNAPQKVTPLFW
jgi:hypothetical protein